MHQIMVAHTNRISAAARGRFRIPNWIGVKIRLATRFMAKGKATSEPTLLRSVCTNTKPKLIRLIGYRIRQISPIVAGAGVHAGFASELYRSIQGISDSLFMEENE